MDSASYWSVVSSSVKTLTKAVRKVTTLQDVMQQAMTTAHKIQILTAICDITAKKAKLYRISVWTPSETRWYDFKS